MNTVSSSVQLVWDSACVVTGLGVLADMGIGTFVGKGLAYLLLVAKNIDCNAHYDKVTVLEVKCGGNSW
jgi:hypothetical protein